MTPAILIHLTPFAPRILPDAPIPHPSRWMSLHGPTPVQTVRKLSDRLERPLDRLSFRMAASPGEVEVIDPAAPTDVLAIVVDGLGCADLQAAHAAANAGRLL
jgi:hypothetical protein